MRLPWTTATLALHLMGGCSAFTPLANHHRAAPPSRALQAGTLHATVSLEIDYDGVLELVTLTSAACAEKEANRIGEKVRSHRRHHPAAVSPSMPPHRHRWPGAAHHNSNSTSTSTSTTNSAWVCRGGRGVPRRCFFNEVGRGGGRLACSVHGALSAGWTPVGACGDDMRSGGNWAHLRGTFPSQVATHRYL